MSQKTEHAGFRLKSTPGNKRCKDELCWDKAKVLTVHYEGLKQIASTVDWCFYNHITTYKTESIVRV